MEPTSISRVAAGRLLLFDGECGICSWLAERARMLDRRGACSILPYQDLPEAELALWGVTRADCAGSLHLLEEMPDRDGAARTGGAAEAGGAEFGVQGPAGASGQTARRRIHRGAFAVNAFLWTIPPWPVAVALLYLLPPLLGLEILGYRLVARHRAAISRRLGLAGCRVEEMTRAGRVR
jgi:predicted DCC family thiol-disulfide oxidoreductase YuxK